MMRRKSKKKAKAKSFFVETVPVNRFEDAIAMIYGPPGIGKSTFASESEKPIFLATEPGLKFLRVRVEPIKNWEDFREMVKLLCNSSQKKIPRSHTVIDTIDNLAVFCMAYVCQKRKIDHPADQAYGKGWEALRREWSSQLMKLALHENGLMLIGHSIIKEVEFRGLTREMVVPNMQKTCFDVVNKLCDYIFCAQSRERKTNKKNKKGKSIWKEERVLFTKPSSTILAKDRTGDFPKVIPFSFASVKKAFTENHINKES